MIQAKERGGSFDAAAFAARVKSAVAEVVRRQAEAGIDIIADGEMGRFGFIPYVNERLTGLEARPNPRSEGTWARSREHLAFPEYYAWAAQMPGAAGGAQRAQWVCTGPIVYKGHEALARDIDNLKAALAPVGYEDAFMPAVSPAQLAGWNKNEFYKTDEEFGLALADALREEYRAIVDAGLVLQIDDPQLASHYTTHPELDIAQCRNWASVTVELLNHALAGIPAERVRYHTCYGINMGPRVHDLELKHIVDIMLHVNAGAYSFEAGNPRHEHEWRVWEESKLPDGKLLIPGVITHGSKNRAFGTGSEGCTLAYCSADGRGCPVRCDLCPIRGDPGPGLRRTPGGRAPPGPHPQARRARHRGGIPLGRHQLAHRRHVRSGRSRSADAWRSGA
jgi:5-methyltetrahydropteroyltriglutamate--homocysteine methyltransferase